MPILEAGVTVTLPPAPVPVTVPAKRRRTLLRPRKRRNSAEVNRSSAVLTDGVMALGAAGMESARDAGATPGDESETVKVAAAVNGLVMRMAIAASWMLAVSIETLLRSKAFELSLTANEDRITDALDTEMPGATMLGPITIVCAGLITVVVVDPGHVTLA